MKKTLKLPISITSFMGVFRKKDYAIYLVGGPVRDLLLGKKTENWDFATNATPEKIQELFPDAVYNNDFGTVMISFEHKKETFLCEVTPFRKEGDYQDNRHPGKIEWAQTIEEDVTRRDFTINALAYDGEKITDIVSGQKDLEEKIIRAVGDPDKRFAEDALRLMRAVRFATQLEFLIEENTRTSIIKNAHLIVNISLERIRDEFLKILASNHPADGLILLKQTGLLKHILPEVEACFEIEQISPGRHHIHDVGTHLIETVRMCPSADSITRFAALLHDVGKATTRAVDEKTGIVTFYDHEIVGASQTHTIAERFKLSKKDKIKLVTLVRYHMFPVYEHQTDSALRRFIRNVGKENLEDMLAIRTGDRLGSGATETSWRTELFKKRLVEVQQKPFDVTDLKINGDDVMKVLNIKPGKKIGEILKNIFEKVASNGIENKREILLEEIKKITV